MTRWRSPAGSRAYRRRAERHADPRCHGARRRERRPAALRARPGDAVRRRAYRGGRLRRRLWRRGFDLARRPRLPRADFARARHPGLRAEGIDEAAAPGRDEIEARLAETAAAHGLVRLDGFVFVVPGTGKALVNMTHVETSLDPIGATAAALEGKDQSDRVLAFLKAEFARPSPRPGSVSTASSASARPTGSSAAIS